MKAIPILGTPLAVTNYAELSHFLIDRSRQPESYAVDFSNTHIVTKRRHEPSFRKLTSSMDLFCPDGMPLIWAMNARGARLNDRVYGPAFTNKFLSCAPSDTTHYLVGGSTICGEQFRARMLKQNSMIKFIGSFHGNCSIDGILDEDDRVREEIRALSPNFIWVGLGTPKQYAWISRMKSQLPSGTLFAVGFAFDVNAGTKPDAPMWMQRYGLTWLYRMANEPGRLGGRYLKWNSLFLWYLIRDSFTRRI